MKLTNKNLLDVKNPFCNKVLSQNFQEQADKLISTMLYGEDHLLIKKLVGDTPINEVSYLCPHIHYTVGLYSIRGHNIFAHAVKNQLRYFLVDKENEILSYINFDITRGRILNLRETVLLPKSDPISEILLEASQKTELQNYELRTIQTGSDKIPLNAIWFHGEDFFKDIIVPLNDYFKLKEGHFYSRKEVLSAMSQAIDGHEWREMDILNNTDNNENVDFTGDL